LQSLPVDSVTRRTKRGLQFNLAASSGAINQQHWLPFSHSSRNRMV